ncbi:diguanylate cyclase (GGDEF) domain protein [Campylobacter rectus RM3267]|uniref:diguanylate cyclase n=2 Tax=Campylobacter rectus TaxID=203 RepID=A0A6G5QNQ9_CAMRE|nr:diguanylate cyclase [Campylobacter rectus]EEF13982.1 diguanylate cyclase (GGDEF) domain protein [Campylobacter rectus RM3267]QCD47224.1 bile resistance regulator [Campylobacter rectus]UEB47920.1 diguanylate cyclase [Campylobacter rectus]
MEKNKILIVEDNKALAKLIAKKMEDKVEMDIDIAHSLAEAQAFLTDPKEYFIALLDLNLPDAPNGEVVDYVISKGLPSIVLTGSMDEATRESFIHKDIVDYVYKGNMDDINYIFRIINRLSKNRQYKVMVVEDSAPFRSALKKILTSLQFQVFTAAHGEEAMNYFTDNPDIKLALCDYRMPVKDGLEVLKEIRAIGDKNQIGVLMMTSPSENVNGAIFLKNGANDFIAKPFVKEELICRVNNTIEAMENINQIADFANKDFLTGVYNRRYFYENMNEYVAYAEEHMEPYVVAMLDIDHFKKINDTHGHNSGDKVLKTLAKKLIDETKGDDLIARFGGEEFCIILKDISNEDAVKFFVNLRANIANCKVQLKKEQISFTVSIGVAFSRSDYRLDELLELADEALYRAKENGRNRVEIA